MPNEIVTHLKGDSSDLKRKLDEGENLADKFADHVTSRFALVGAAIATYFSAQAIGGFFRDAVHEASGAEDALAKFNAMLKATGEEAPITTERMEKLASKMQNLTKSEDDAVIAAGTVLLRFKSVDANFERTIKLASNMAEMFGGIEGAASMLGRSLENPEQGMRMLRIAGVRLTEEQQKQIKSFMELGEAEKAQEIVLAELEKRYNGVGEAMAETLSGQTAKLQHAIGDVKEEIGGALIPILKDMIPALREGGDAAAVLAEEFAVFMESFDTAAGEGGVNEYLVEMVALLAAGEEGWKLMGLSLLKVLADTKGQWDAMTNDPNSIWSTIRKYTDSSANKLYSTGKGITDTVAAYGDLPAISSAHLDEVAKGKMRRTSPEAEQAYQDAKSLRERLEADFKKKILGAMGESNKDAADRAEELLLGGVTVEDVDAAKETIADKMAKKQDEVRERLKAKRKEREDADKSDLLDPDANSDEAMQRAITQQERLAKQMTDEDARRQVELHGPGNRRAAPGKAGFGQGFGAKEDAKDADLFQSSIEDLLSLGSRISAAAASESPAKKIENAVERVEKAVIDAGIRQVEALGPQGPIRKGLDEINTTTVTV